MRSWFDEATKTVTAKCSECGRVFTYPCSKKQWKMLNEGALIQDVFPTLSANDRELFQTGWCGKCYDALCGGMPDE